MSARPLATKDNASGQLNAGISAVVTSIPLQSGNGANFPTTYNGSATSGGTARLLNSTGIQAAGVTAGMIIENVTDGSYCIVLSVSTNAVVTTALRGGAANTWANTNVWAVNRFVVTLINYAANGTTVVKTEKVLIGQRSTDTLTVATGGRGYDGSTAQTFSTNDYVYIFNTELLFDGLKQTVVDAMKDIDNRISQTGAEIYAASATGNDSYAVTLAPVPAAYTNGMEVSVKADVANVGACTLNVNGLGAKNIYKSDGATALNDNDIVANEVFTVVYNSSLNAAAGGFLLQTPLANVYAAKSDILNQTPTYVADSGTANAYATTLAPAATAYTTGMVVCFKAGNACTGASTLNVNALGTKNIFRSGAALVTGDIFAGQIVTCVYDGTQFQLVSACYAKVNMIAATRLMTAGAGNVSYAHGLGVAPKWIKIRAIANNTAGPFAMSDGFWLQGGTYGCNFITLTAAVQQIPVQSTSLLMDIEISTGATYQRATVNTVDATNISLAYTVAGSNGTTIDFIIECGV